MADLPKLRWSRPPRFQFVSARGFGASEWSHRCPCSSSTCPSRLRICAHPALGGSAVLRMR
eukprot:5220031-Alexandrium_andersonii.AAC.1